MMLRLLDEPTPVSPNIPILGRNESKSGMHVLLFASNVLDNDPQLQ
jgi:hypothetical protein